MTTVETQTGRPCDDPGPDAEVTAFTFSPKGGADRLALHAFLVSQLAYEQARRTREGLLVFLASASVAIWALAEWPALLATELRSAVLAAWGIVFLATLGASLVEWLRRRRAQQARTDLPPA